MQTFDAQLALTEIPVGQIALPGELHVPSQAQGLVLFAHSTGSSRHRPRNQRVASFLQEIGLATLLFDLLAPDEEPEDTFNVRLRFDIDLLAGRLRTATLWAR